MVEGAVERKRTTSSTMKAPPPTPSPQEHRGEAHVRDAAAARRDCAAALKILLFHNREYALSVARRDARVAVRGYGPKRNI